MALVRTPTVLDIYHGDIVVGDRPGERNGFVDAYKFGIRGIIHKATQGSANKDSALARRLPLMLAAGMLVGFYHFGDRTDVHAQVTNFLSTKPSPDTLICLDFEPVCDAHGNPDPARTMTLAQARQWIELVEAALNRPGECVFYSGSLIKEDLENNIDPFFAARRLWLPQYGPAPHVPKTWTIEWMWQFAETKYPVPGIPGAGGNLDLNFYPGNDLEAEWAHGATGAPVHVAIPGMGSVTRSAVPFVPSPNLVPRTVTGLQHALNVLGYGKLAEDGKLGPGTEATLETAQRALGLSVDGKAGPQTYGALEDAIKAKPIQDTKVPDSLPAPTAPVSPPEVIKPLPPAATNPSFSDAVAAFLKIIENL